MDRGRGTDGHRQYEDMAVSHVLGGLSQAHGQVFRSHLLECADCRARVGELRAIAHELADVERDERRARAAKSLETKSRDAEDTDTEEDVRHTGSRWSRLILVLGLLAMTLLAGWNFVLRDQIARLRIGLEQRVAATTALELGAPWTVTLAADGVDGSVRQHEDDLVAVVDGLEDPVYSVYLLNADDGVLYRGLAETHDGAIMPVPMPAEEAARLIVTSADDGTLTTSPTGSVAFQAEAP